MNFFLKYQACSAWSVKFSVVCNFFPLFRFLLKVRTKVCILGCDKLQLWLWFMVNTKKIIIEEKHYHRGDMKIISLLPEADLALSIYYYQNLD